MLNRDKVKRRWRRLVPGMEPGTLKSRKAGANQASFDSYSLEKIKFKRLTKEDTEAVGAVLAHRYRIVQLWGEHQRGATAIGIAALPCPDPKVSDIFVAEDATEWVVERVTHQLLGEVFDCLCQKNVGA